MGARGRPGASIVVYNAAYEPDNGTANYVRLFKNLIEAMQQASQLPGVSVVTLSYGIARGSPAAAGLSEQTFDADFTTPGVTFLAAAGDYSKTNRARHNNAAYC